MRSRGETGTGLRSAWLLVSDSPWAAWSGALLIAICAVWFTSLRAPGSYAWPDSGTYVDGARHLAAGQGFRISLVSIGEDSPRPVAIFPPGFPALVAIGIRMGLPVRESASLVLSIAYVGYTLAAYALVLFAAGRRWWPLAAGVALFLALQPLVIHAMESVLSDLPFAAFATAGAALAVLVAARRRPSRLALAALGAALALAVFVRWAGFFTLLAIVLAVLVGAGSSWTRAERVRRVAWIAVGPLVLLSAMCLRNLVTTGTLLGHRVFALAAFLETLGAARQGLGSGFTGILPGAGRALAAMVVLGVLAAVFGGLATERRRAVRVLAVSAAVYTALVIGIALIQPFDALWYPRFWLPIWPLVGALLAATAAGIRRPSLAAPVVAVLLLCLAGLGAGYALVLQGVPSPTRARNIFGNPAVADSVPMRWARERRSSCRVLSNAPRALLAHGAFDAIHTLPTSLEAMAPLLDAGDEAFCIAWFSEPGSPSVEERRRDNRTLLWTLAQRGRIARVDRDGLGEFWVSRPARPGGTTRARR
jgi:hypothetical protein